MRELELVCANPQKVASYSRFVIPFAYRLKEKGSGGMGKYQQDKPDDLPGWKRREEYLTSETEKVLFESAKWFKLEGKDFPIKINFCLDVNKNIAAFVATPQLVLFEYPKDNPQEGLDEKEWDILQVGLLILEVYFEDNTKYKPTLDDLIKINELFRYIDEPFEGHYEDRELGIFLNCDSLKKLMPENKGGDVTDSFCKDNFYKRWQWLLKDMTIGSEKGIEYTLVAPSEGEELSKNTYPDNRAFVWTCAILPEGAKHLWQASPFTNWKASSYGHWIKLLNVDFPGTTPEETHKSREFERKWIEERTYHRWEEWGTYYGFTSHSGAVIAPQRYNLPIWQHFGQMYFDQVLLLLYLRSVLFRFSAKLSQISREARDNRNGAKDKWTEEFQKLRWEFALFTNLYQFPLLSNQQQGIELYTLARKCMEVDDLFKEVQEEIHSSHDYLSQQQNQEQTNITTILTVIAAIFSVVSIGLVLLDKKEQLKQKLDNLFVEWISIEAFIVLLVSGVGFLAVLIFSKGFAGIFKRLADVPSKVGNWYKQVSKEIYYGPQKK